MKKTIYHLSVLVLSIFYSCSETEFENESFPFSGNYEIEQMTSDKAVDLNGDEITSTNLMTEIASYYFDNTVYDLEIRPNNLTDSNAKLISFMIPDQSLLFGYPDDPNGYIDYSKKGFGSLYKYSNNTIELLTIENEFVSVKKVEILENNRIKSVIKKEYFDSKTQNWVNLSIEILYAKKDLEAL